MWLRRGNLWQTEPKVIGKSKSIIRIAREVTTKPNSAVRSTEVCNAGLNLWAEMAHETLDGPCRCIAQSTDCAAFNLFSVGE